MRHVADDGGAVFATFAIVEMDRRERCLDARRAARRRAPRDRAYDREFQRVVFGAQVKRAAVGAAEVHRFEQNSLEQTVPVVLRREGRSDIDQFLEKLGAVALSHSRLDLGVQTNSPKRIPHKSRWPGTNLAAHPTEVEQKGGGCRRAGFTSQGAAEPKKGAALSSGAKGWMSR